MRTEFKQASRFEQCQICPIRNRSVCAALSDAELSGLNVIAHHQHFSAGQIIMSDQESALFLAALRLRVVKLTRKSSDRGREIVGELCGNVGDGDFQAAA